MPRSTATGSSESLSFAFATDAASHAVDDEPAEDEEDPDFGADEEPGDTREDAPGARHRVMSSRHGRDDEDHDDGNGAAPDEDERGPREIGDDEDAFVFDDDREERTGEAHDEEEGDGDTYDDPDDDSRREDQPRFVRGEDELRVEPEIREHAPGRSWLVFLVLLAIFWANLALYLRNHPAEATTLLSHVPVAGPWLTEDRLLQMRLHLQDVSGAWQKIKDDRRVFIISGRAFNTSQQPLKGVQIESTLLGDGGSVLDTKAIFCGNAMSLKIVKDLSSKEISLLQRLEPPQRFEIRPGDSAAFTVVFMDPPKGMREFTARVVGAQRVT